MVLLNLKPACFHMSVKFCVNRSVIVSTLLLFSAVFSLFFCRAFRKAWCNTTPDGLAKPVTSEPRMDSGDYQKGCEVHLEAEEMQEEG